MSTIPVKVVAGMASSEDATMAASWCLASSAEARAWISRLSAAFVVMRERAWRRAVGPARTDHPSRRAVSNPVARVTSGSSVFLDAAAATARPAGG